MIKENVLGDKVSQLCVLFSPLVCCETSASKISSYQSVNTNSFRVLTVQDEDLKILEDLDWSEITSDNANLSDDRRLSG